MPKQPDLSDALRRTGLLILAIRKAIAETGHLEAMVEIDALLAVAQAESDRRLTGAVAPSPTQTPSVPA